MRIPHANRAWILVVALGATALVAATMFAAQSLFANGTLVPFADPTDSPGNDVATFESSVPNTAASTWHYHTGPLYGVVRQGTLIEDLGCGNVKEFPVGTAFHDPGHVVHQVRNAGNMEVQFSNFQIYPHGAPLIVNASEPTCP
jgi:quercetin dioxygenase-like cupin family protein